MNSYDLDETLIELTRSTDKKSWTIRQAVEGVQIFGGIGSGKTSGSGRLLALKYLSAGFGGLVLSTKPDEKEMWAEYCALTGRENDLLVVEPDSGHFFNFLEYESSRAGSSNAITENIVNVLKTVIRASEEKSNGKSDDPFWETALDMLIFNVIDLCKLAYGSISVKRMFEIVQNIPKPETQEIKSASPNAFREAFDRARVAVIQKIEEWKTEQPVEVLSEMEDENSFDEIITKEVSDARLLKILDQFFMETYYNLSEKTRSIIDFSFTGFLFRLMRDPVNDLFCRNASTFIPEDSIKGKIIFINLPVKIYDKIGRDCQVMFKYIWQRAMEKRNIIEDCRPVFLWADEAQNFLHEHDPEYQATARSSRIATVYISQNLPNYYSNMGGAKAEYRVKSFLGTLATKIFHANADIETNRYASELIGDDYYEEMSRTATAAGQFSASRTVSVKLERLVRPEEFMSLKTGGASNQYRVEGFLHCQGSTLSSNLNHIKMAFNQNYSPNPKHLST